MQFLRKILAYFPRIIKLLKSLYYRLPGVPPVAYDTIIRSNISQDLIRELIAKEDPTILEIGCNDGKHTLWFLQMFKSPKLYCFEPDPRAIARFKAKVGPRANVHLFEIALSDHNGDEVFHQSGGLRNQEDAKVFPGGWDLSGSLRQPKEHLKAIPWVKFDDTITVTTSTLDAWSTNYEIGIIDFISVASHKGMEFE